VHRMRWKTRVWALAIGSIALPQAFAQTAFHVHFADSAGVVDAITRGDYDALVALSKQPDISQSPATVLAIQAGEARVRGNLAQSTQFAKQCYKPESLADGHSADMICGLLLAGNALDQGDIATWAKLTLEIKEKSKPMLDKFALLSLAQWQQTTGKAIDAKTMLANYDVDAFALVAELENFGQWPYATTLEGDSSKASAVALSWNATDPTKQESRLPFVNLTVNGHTVSALLDTGSSVSLAISPEDAQKFGISHITPGWIKLDHLGTMESASLGNADTVSLGGERFKHLPVVVTPGAPMPVIGANLLRQLGSYKLSSTQLTVLPQLPASCAVPITVSSAISGPLSYLIYPIDLDGQPQQAIFDTGMAMPLFGMARNFEALANAPGAQTKVVSFLIGGEPRTTPYVQRSAQLTLDRQTLKIDYPTFDGRNEAFSYGLASHILDHFDFYADFNNGRMCFVADKKS